MSQRPPLSDEDLNALSAYIDDELPPSERDALDARLNSDSHLRDELESLRFTSELLRGLPPMKAPRDFTLEPAAFETVSKRQTRPHKKVRPLFSTRRVLRFAGGLSVAAAALVLVSAIVLVGSSGDDAAPMSAPVAENAIIEQTRNGFEVTLATDSAPQATIVAANIVPTATATLPSTVETTFRTDAPEPTPSTTPIVVAATVPASAQESVNITAQAMAQGGDASEIIAEAAVTATARALTIPEERTNTPLPTPIPSATQAANATLGIGDNDGETGTDDMSLDSEVAETGTTQDFAEAQDESTVASAAPAAADTGRDVTDALPESDGDVANTPSVVADGFNEPQDEAQPAGRETTDTTQAMDNADQDDAVAADDATGDQDLQQQSMAGAGPPDASDDAPTEDARSEGDNANETRQRRSILTRIVLELWQRVLQLLENVR